MKKISSIIITLILLISTVLIIIPSVSAESPCYIRGYVLEEGGMPTENLESLKLIFPELTANGYISGDPVGYYQIDFMGESGEIGTFQVTVDGKTYNTIPATFNVPQGGGLFPLNLTINTSSEQVNTCPDVPTNPSPSDGATHRPTSLTLSVNVNDFDGNTMTVTFYDASDDSTIGTDSVAGSGTASVTWSGLDNSETYQWYVISDDGTCDSSQSDTWSFTTKQKSSPNPPFNPNPPSSNKKPVADAGGPYYGTEGEEIEFDGSNSYDPDGDIVSYSWDFGDENNGNGTNPTHSYYNYGEYTIILTVEDNDGSKDTDTATLLISEPTYPPEDPTITGPSEGLVNISYNFTISATDRDNDTIQYVIEWGDGENTTTDFLANGTSTKQTHMWDTPGTYTITVRAYDNDTYSGPVSHTITIEKPEEQTPPLEPKENEDNTIYYIAGILILLLLIIIAFLATRKKEKK